ncbi:MAG: SLC13/DASS family transporter [Nitrospirae bacterium]|nr:MAG: SLC13/DASS family transporter [Nitrospirota bacterium]
MAAPAARPRWLAMAAGPVAAAVVWAARLDPAHPAVGAMAGAAVWMAVWWLFEAVPLGVTALLPVVLFPLIGIAPGKVVARAYFNSVIFLFLGGFLVALAMERWRLHRRIALRILLWVGGSPGAVVLGFMAVTAFLSMWISNTATTMMLVPMAMAVIRQMEQERGREAVRPFAVALLLGVAYAASEGGVATLIGTPPNLAFAQIFATTFPQAPEISFARWMVLGLPVSLVMLALTWFLLTRVLHPVRGVERIPRRVLAEEHAALGPVRPEEGWVLALSVAAALLWIFRRPIHAGPLTLPGWSGLFAHPKMIDDGTVAVAIAALLFVIPAEGGRTTLLDWETARGLPWGIVLLLGGGFALAAGVKESGLGGYLARHLAAAAHVGPVAMMAGVSTVMTFLTELTSNTATTQMALPIVAQAAVALHTDPRLLMIPATLSASCAFMMPVATPPNAIVFGARRLTIRDMARAGLLLNLVGVVVITAGVYLLGLGLFHVDPSVTPPWAGPPAG